MSQSRYVHHAGHFALLLLGGCGDPPPTWYGDVQPITEARCANCHQEGGIGPFPLVTYGDVVARRTSVRLAVESGSMPPWPARPGDVPFAHDPSLTPEQIATIVDWVAADAPMGDPEEAGEPLADVFSSLTRSDLRLAMPEPFRPSVMPDEYRCFILDWPETTSAFVTGFNVTPGNPRIVHHVAAYLIPPDTLMGEEVFDTLRRWDTADDTPGYSCFGGPSGPQDLQIPVQQLAQWVPGNAGTDFPAGTGIEVKPGSQVVLQVHYHAETGNLEADATALELKLDPYVERRAAFAPFLDVTWPLGGMDIPAGEVVTHAVAGDPRGIFGIVIGDQLDLDAGFDIHSVLLHQHTLGTNSSLDLLGADGQRRRLLDIPEYDFDWQITYAFQSPVRFLEGDQLHLSCTFANQGQGAVDVSWGEGTGEEMCVANLYISEI